MSATTYLQQLANELTRITGKTVGAYQTNTLLAAKSVPVIGAATPSPDAIFGRNPDDVDGFNPIWYLHTYADLRAAGVNPYDHWVKYGRGEGRIPYMGAKPILLPASDPLNDPLPTVTFSDVYAPAGAKLARGRIKLSMPDGSPPRRAFSFNVMMVNGTVGYGAYGDLTCAATVFPHDMGEIEFTLPIFNPGAIGYGNILLLNSEDAPGFAQMAAKVYFNTPAPVGYAMPDPLPKRIVPVWAVPKQPPILNDDLLSSFKVTTNGGKDSYAAGRGNRNINTSIGLFNDPTVDKTAKAGKPVNAFSIVNGKRRFGVVDCRDDNVVAPNGAQYPYSAPLISTRGRLPAFTLGAIEIDYMTAPRVQGCDYAALWMLKYDSPDWPPEYDLVENFYNHPFSRDTITAHGAGGQIQRHNPFIAAPQYDASVQMITRRVVFTTDSVMNFVNDRLTDGSRNYFPDVGMEIICGIEVPGGAGGPPLDGFDYAKNCWMDVGGLRVYV